MTTVNDDVEDFPGPSGQYYYDDNGNLITDGSRNMDIDYYNTLNLPGVLDFGNDNLLHYYYTATGDKLIKQVMPDGEPLQRLDYLGNFVYEDGKLAYIISGEGRLIPIGTGEEDCLYMDIT